MSNGTRRWISISVSIAATFSATVPATVAGMIAYPSFFESLSGERFVARDGAIQCNICVQVATSTAGWQYRETKSDSSGRSTSPLGSLPERGAPAPRQTVQTKRVASAAETPRQSGIRNSTKIPTHSARKSKITTPADSRPPIMARDSPYARDDAAYIDAKPIVSTHQVTADDYPAISIRKLEEGTVFVKIRVNEFGNVDRCQVMTSSGTPRLDDAACAVTERWKYIPAMRQGIPIAVDRTAQVNFHLDRPIPDMANAPDAVSG